MSTKQSSTIIVQIQSYNRILNKSQVSQSAVDRTSAYKTKFKHFNLSLIGQESLKNKFNYNWCIRLCKCTKKEIHKKQVYIILASYASQYTSDVLISSFVPTVSVLSIFPSCNLLLCLKAYLFTTESASTFMSFCVYKEAKLLSLS